MFVLKSNNNINEKEIQLMISNFLFDIIEKYIPHKLLLEEEPFINKYNGKISYDYSGKVEKITIVDLKELVKNLGENSYSICYTSKLDELLSEIYIDEWTPSYVSNYGKDWSNYKYLLENRFNDWKYENFDLYDEDGNELNEELEISLDDMFYNFLNENSIDIYYAKVLSKLK